MKPGLVGCELHTIAKNPGLNSSTSNWHRCVPTVTFIPVRTSRH